MSETEARREKEDTMSFTSYGFQHQRQAGKGLAGTFLRRGLKKGMSLAKSAAKSAKRSASRSASAAKKAGSSVKKKAGATKAGKKISAKTAAAGGKKKLLKKAGVATALALAPEAAMMGYQYATSRGSADPITHKDIKKAAVRAGSNIFADGMAGKFGAKRTAKSVSSAWRKVMEGKGGNHAANTARLQQNMARQNTRFNKLWRMYNKYDRRTAGYNRAFGTGAGKKKKKKKGKKKKKKGKKKKMTKKKGGKGKKKKKKASPVHRYTSMNIPAAASRRSHQLRKLMRPA